MKAEDVRRIPKIIDHTLSPDGKLVVFVLRTTLGDGVANELWSVATTKGSTARPLTTRGFNDLAPSISPDGKKIAFVRALAQSCQLCIYDLADGSVDVRAESGPGMGMAASVRHIRGIAAPQWSPDGSRIAYIAPVREAWPVGGSSAVVIRTLPYQFDGRGYTHDNFLHIFLVDARGGSAPRQVSSALADYWDVAWRPDGHSICFGSNRAIDGCRAQALYEATIDEKGEARSCRRLTDGRCTVNLPSYSPSGRIVHFVGIGPIVPAQPDIRGRNVSLWQVDVCRNVPVQVRVSDPQTFDIDESRVRPLIVSDDAKVTLSIVARGAVELGEMVDGAWTPLIQGECQVSSYAQANDVKTAVLMKPTNASELVVIREHETECLTDFRAQYQDVPLQHYVEVEGHASDGYPVHGWLVMPSSVGPHPLLLLIHGGPDTQWGYALNEEAQAYASAGFGVLMPNPRGSAGYGEAHARVLNGRLGTVDVDDVLALLDVATARNDIDASNVGVLGRSYGGFLTAWLASHHGERFRAAIGECGIYDWSSALSTSDIGWQLSAMVGEDPRDWHACSPLTYVARIEVPFLVMHYLSDLRIPLEQGHRMFAALFRSGNPTELVQFSGGPHTFADTGSPSDRAARLRIIIDWFSRWLRQGHLEDSL